LGGLWAFDWACQHFFRKNKKDIKDSNAFQRLNTPLKSPTQYHADQHFYFEKLTFEKTIGFNK